MKSEKRNLSDLEECKEKIIRLLKEYNCRLTTTDDYCWPLLEDNDTGETTGGFK